MNIFCFKHAAVAMLAIAVALTTHHGQQAYAANNNVIAVEIVNGVHPKPRVLVGAYVNGKWVGEVWLGYHQGPSPGLRVKKGDRVRIYASWNGQSASVTFTAQKKPERVQPKLDSRGRLYLLKS